MSSLLLVALLAQSPLANPAAENSSAPSSSEAVASSPSGEWAEGATQRFVGAFVGGFVGMAIPVGIAAALYRCTACSTTFGSVVAAGLAPFVSVAGATLGFMVMSGRQSVGAAIAGLMGGMASALVVLLFHNVALTNESRWGVTIAAGALMGALQAVALESRHEALDEAPFLAAPTKRFAFSVLGQLGVTAGLGLVAGVIGLLTVGIPSVPVIVAVLGGLVVPLVPWTIHRNLGGEGELGAAYLGWVSSLAVAAGGLLAALTTTVAVSISDGTDPRPSGLVGVGVALAVTSVVFGTPLMLEWSHGNARRVGAIKPQLAAGPITGPRGITGGVVGLSGTF